MAQDPQIQLQDSNGNTIGLVWVNADGDVVVEDPATGNSINVGAGGLDVDGADIVDAASTVYDATQDEVTADVNNTSTSTEGVAISDTAADPTANGEFTLNGTDVKVYTGGGVKNLTDIGSGSGGGVSLISSSPGGLVTLGAGESYVLDRVTVPTGKSFEVHKAYVTDDTGAVPTGLEVEAYNQTDAVSIYSATSQTLQEGSPLASGAAGDEVIVRLVNGSGGTVDAASKLAWRVV